jgi:NAD(P)-dependent dehydrogenase (short-subunit alcohol dehydrogenase family)
MQDKQVALVTGANQGIGLQIAKELAAHGFIVLVGPRKCARYGKPPCSPTPRCASVQVALALLLQRSPNILVIPGTSSLDT